MSRKILKIYLDVCCLNRPFDDQVQTRIRLESEAVILILGAVDRGKFIWVSSYAMELEIARNPDEEHKRRLEILLRFASSRIPINQSVVERALVLEDVGFTGFDAVHIACAEMADADVFLTTDDRLIKNAKRVGIKLSLKVENPLKWLEEVKDE